MLPEAAPALNELFAFMAQAELRFDSLRMRILDQQITTHGEENVVHDVWLRHPGFAKVVSTRGEPSDGDYDVWACDGETVHTFNALGRTATQRRAPRPPRGLDETDLPRHSQVYFTQTALQAETLADTRAPAQAARLRREIERNRTAATTLADSLTARPDPMVRVLLLLLPRQKGQ